MTRNNVRVLTKDQLCFLDAESNGRSNLFSRKYHIEISCPLGVVGHIVAKTWHLSINKLKTCMVFAS